MNKHLLRISDLETREIRALIDRAMEMKGKEQQTKPLVGKVVALVFQKPSMRTRVAFEVAVDKLGGSVIYLGQDNIQLGSREPIKDVARVLSGYVDGIVVRMFAHADVMELAHYSTVPVVNGLSDATHPCQALADLMTIQEHFRTLEGIKVAYVGDGNNVLHSLAHACALTGVHLTAATPNSYRPDPSFWAEALEASKTTGATIECLSDPEAAVRGAKVVYTDVWVSMGQEAERGQRLKDFQGYQVNEQLLSLAHPAVRVMHCLPAHRGEEITDEVIEGGASLIFQQAENRLHIQQALLEQLIGSQGKA